MPTHEPAFHPQSEEDQEQDQPTLRRCRHIFAAGRRCGSPCLRAQHFCYYHHTTRRPVSSPRERRNRTDVLDLPNPEDRDSARAAVTQIMHAIAHNNIDMKRAGMLLYSLQISLCTLPPQPRPAPLKTPNSTPLKDIVEDLVYEEPHGFIAPEDDYEEPEELKPRRSLARQLLDEVERYEARQAAEKEAEEEARRLQDVEETQEELRRCQAAREAEEAARRPAAIDLRAAAESACRRMPHAARFRLSRCVGLRAQHETYPTLSSFPYPTLSSFAEGGGPASAPTVVRPCRHSERSTSQRPIARDGIEEPRRCSIPPPLTSPPPPEPLSHKDSRLSPRLRGRLRFSRALKQNKARILFECGLLWLMLVG